MACAGDPQNTTASIGIGVGLAAKDQPLFPSAPPVAPPVTGPATFLLGTLLLILAFLVASFPARNSDLWPHLAAGRLLAHGDYEFGRDPFVYASVDGWWVNHSWLYDLLSYGLYELTEGSGLVVFKALLIAMLALVLFGTASASARPATRAATTALALVALTPGLALRPICVSYLFLGLTIWLLERGRTRFRHQQAGSSFGRALLAAYGWLLPLFALWANVDAWFLLGPLTVGLYALGSVLANLLAPPASAASGGSPSRFADSGALGGILLAGLAACLLNPHFVRVFELPAALGLSEAAQLLGREALPVGPGLSPFDPTFLSGPARTVAGVAYYLLILLGLASFAVNPRWDWPRTIAWLGMLLLSSYQARLIPFFAIVAGPMLADNLGRAWANRPPVVSSRLAIVGAVLLCLLLSVAAWPGWLRGEPTAAEPRGWTIEADPALKETALQLRQWRKEGKFSPEEKGLGLSRDIANVFAWFCPEEKGFFDSRLHLDRKAAAEFLAIRRGLAASSEGKEAKVPDWREFLRRRKISHLILLSGRRETEIRDKILQHCLTAQQEWSLVYLRGSVAVFGWHDPSRPEQSSRFVGWRPNPDRLAFGSPPWRAAPAEGPPHDPEPRPWWSGFTGARPTWYPDPDREEAAFYGLQFKLARRYWYERVLTLYRFAAVARAAGGPPFAGTLPTLAVGPALAQIHENTWPDMRVFLFAYGDGPAALPYLAVRTARCSLARNPDDPASLMVLARAYLDLATGTRERMSAPVFPKLSELRTVQASVALNAALRLKPDNVDAHLELATLYEEQKALDLALEHYQQAHRYLAARGPQTGQERAAFDKQLEQIRDRIAALDRTVEKSREIYDLKTEDVPVFDKAALAARIGLFGKALEVLTESDYAAFGNEGMDLELALLLFVGRTQDVRDWMRPWQEEKLGSARYHWLRAELEAATGHYEEADRELAKVAPLKPNVRIELVSSRPMTLRETIAIILSREVIDRAPGPGLAMNILSQDRFDQLYALVLKLHQQAAVLTLRGLLALEVGQNSRAQEHFRSALAIWHTLTLPEAIAPEAGAGQALARYGLDLLECGQNSSQP
jgi:tetratricopeptide (TPR) repeat protein